MNTIQKLVVLFAFVATIPESRAQFGLKDLKNSINQTGKMLSLSGPKQQGQFKEYFISNTLQYPTNGILVSPTNDTTFAVIYANSISPKYVLLVQPYAGRVYNSDISKFKAISIFNRSFLVNSLDYQTPKKYDVTLVEEIFSNDTIKAHYIHGLSGDQFYVEGVFLTNHKGEKSYFKEGTYTADVANWCKAHAPSLYAFAAKVDPKSKQENAMHDVFNAYTLDDVGLLNSISRKPTKSDWCYVDEQLNFGVKKGIIYSKNKAVAKIDHKGYTLTIGSIRGQVLNLTDKPLFSFKVTRLSNLGDDSYIFLDFTFADGAHIARIPLDINSYKCAPSENGIAGLVLQHGLVKDDELDAAAVAAFCQKYDISKHDTNRIKTLVEANRKALANLVPRKLYIVDSYSNLPEYKPLGYIKSNSTVYVMQDNRVIGYITSDQNATFPKYSAYIFDVKANKARLVSKYDNGTTNTFRDNLERDSFEMKKLDRKFDSMESYASFLVTTGYM